MRCFIFQIKKKPGFYLGIGLLVFFSFLLVLLFSLGLFSKDNNSFYSSLVKIDVAVEQNNLEQAKKLIISAKKNVFTAENWLSLIKRCVGLNFDNLACDLARESLLKLPGNDALETVYISLLCKYQKYEEAILRLDDVSSVSSVAQKLWLDTKLKEPFQMDGEIWSEAGFLFNKPEWIKNAAVIEACKGRMNEALSFIPMLSSNLNSTVPFFWSLLAYDNKKYDLAYSWAALSSISALDEKTVLDAYLLMGDSAWLEGKSEDAISAWLYLSQVAPKYSPIPLYNLVQTSSDEVKDNKLKLLLSQFPNYVPALQLAGKIACSRDLEPESDVFTNELLKRGLTTLQMDQNEKNKPMTEPEVKYAFELATIASEAQCPADLALEEFRFIWNSENPKPAVENIWRILEKYPNDSNIYEYAIWLFLSQKRIEDARILYEVALKNFSENKALMFFGGIFATLDSNFSQARTLFRVSISNPSCSWQSVANVAVIDKTEGDWKQATENFTLASSLILNSVDLFKSKEKIYKISSLLNTEAGAIFETHSNYQAASVSYSSALEQDSSNYQARTGFLRVKESLLKIQNR